MNQQSVLMPRPSSPEQHSQGGRRFSGRCLVLARVVWVVIALLSLSILIFGLPAYFTLLHAACESVEACYIHGVLAPEGMRALQTLGISPGAYAAFLVVLTGVTSLVWTAVGWLIFWRKSEEVTALFVALLLVTYSQVNTSAALALTSPAWLVPAKLVSVIAGSSISLLFYLFPNGRFVPGWTRWFALLAVVNQLLIEVTPAGSPINSSWLSVLILLIFWGTMVFSQLYRYRRVSTPIERQQTKWVVFGMAVAMVGVFALVFAFLSVPAFQQPGSAYQFVSTPIYLVVMLSIPLSIGMAILRSRLWDIDLIIKRTLVYGTLTVLLVLTYGGLVIGLGLLLRLFTGQIGQSPVVIVVSTLVIAALFQPLRHRLQGIIDRRFYRRKYDAAKTLAASSATLRQEVDLEQLHEHLLAVVQETMQPVHVSLWLRPPEPASKFQPTWINTSPAHLPPGEKS
jgi:hypothetical protein